MKKPFAFINGSFIPESQASVPLTDMGLVLGAAVTEQLRTFGGRLFHVEDHFRRLYHSLEIVGVDPGFEAAKLAYAAERLVAFNRDIVSQRDDLGLSVFVTPGAYPSLNDGRCGPPLVCMHTYRLAFSLWSEKYETGQALRTTNVQHVPPECWPPDLKCRSRMYYYLADRAAADAESGARALLLDAQGHVLEASTANIVVYFKDQGLVAPPHDTVLPGISVKVLMQLADELGIPHQDRQIVPDDVAQADEVLLTSTPFCVMPATRFNGKPVGDGRPGEIYRSLFAAWSRKVGFGIAEQAKRFAQRD